VGLQAGIEGYVIGDSAQLGGYSVRRPPT